MVEDRGEGANLFGNFDFRPTQRAFETLGWRFKRRMSMGE
jgi:hypothetical protein